MSSPPLRERKVPPRKRKAPYWRLAGGGSDLTEQWACSHFGFRGSAPRVEPFGRRQFVDWKL